MQFIVIENTPGYSPEDEDPFVGTFGEALDVAIDRVIELRDDDFRPRTIIYANVMVFESAGFHLVDDDDPHDLGRVVEVMRI